MRVLPDHDRTISYGGEGGKPEPAKPKPAETPAPDKPAEPGAPAEPAPKA